MSKFHAHAQADLKAPPKERWLGLDLLRALAVVLMVQGHTLSSLLRPTHSGTGWLRWHSFVHGFTAPLFLMASGLAYGFTTYRKWEQHARPSSATTKRLRRYMLLLLIGFSFQLPRASLSWLMHHPSAIFANGVRVGPLHLIAVTLGAMELLVLLVKKRRVFVPTTAALMLFVLAISDPIWRRGWSATFHPFVASWIDETSGSLFPVFPWASFLLAGVLYAHFTVRRGTRPMLRKGLGRTALLAGAAVTGAGYMAWKLKLALTQDPLFWRVHPSFLVFRMGVVLLVLSVCTGAQHLLRPGRDGRYSGWVRYIVMVGQSTLAAYVIHLIILYGSPLTKGLTNAYGKSLSLPETIAACIGVLAITLLLTQLWVKAVSTRHGLKIRWAIFVLVVAGMLLRGC